MRDVKAPRTPIWLILLAVAGLFALYFVRMGSYPLVDPDEPVYGQIAKEMAKGGDWLTPHYFGRPWFDKPPLFYWLSAASIKALGQNELACRLPSAVLAVGLVLLLYAFVKLDFGRRAALLSAIALATCLQTIVLARAAVTDMTLCFCMLGSIYAYRRWLASRLFPVSCSLPWMLPCGLMAGLGMLTKGPVAPFLLFATFFIHLCLTRQLRRIVSLSALAGIIAALAVGLPWFVEMYRINHDAFVRQFIEQNNLARFASAEHKEVTGGWYSIFMNIPVLFVFFFPWSVFLPQAILRMRKSKPMPDVSGFCARTVSNASSCVEQGEEPGAEHSRNPETSAPVLCHLLPVTYFAVVFVFFSLSKTQLVTYIFPLYPMAALFVGVLLDRAASGDIGCANSVRRGLIAGVFVALLFAIATMRYAHRSFPEAQHAAIALGIVLAATLVIALAQRANPIRSGWIIGTGMAVFTLVLMFGVLPGVSSRISRRDLIHSVFPPHRNMNGRYVATLDVDIHKRYTSIPYYLGGMPLELNGIDQAESFLRKEGSAWVICKDYEAAPLRADGFVETARSGVFRVISNRRSGDGSLSRTTKGL